MSTAVEILGVLFSRVATQSVMAGLVFLAVLPAVLVFRRSSARVHAALWSLVLLRLVLPADLAHPLSAANVLRAAVGARTDTATVAPEPQPGSAGPVGWFEAGAREERAGGIDPWAAAWAVGCFIGFIAWRRRLLPWARVAANASPAADPRLVKSLDDWRRRLGVRRSVRLRVARRRSAPFTLGVVRPLIVVPESIARRPDLADAVIAHEMAHVARFDALRQSLQHLLCLVHFFNPVVRIAARRLDEARERACDELVLSNAALSPRRYATALVEVLAAKETSAAPVPALTGRKRRMTMRVKQILDFPFRDTRPPTAAAAVLVLLAVFVVPLAPVSSAPAQALSEPLAAEGAVDDLERDLVQPLPSGRLTLGWGTSRHPYKEGVFHHNGLDLAAPLKTPVVAAASGRVVVAVVEFGDDARGRHLVLDHGAGLTTYYGHLEDLLVEEGQRVSRGETIASVGSTGLSTGPHLHFEVRRDGGPVDPSAVLDAE